MAGKNVIGNKDYSDAVIQVAGVIASGYISRLSGVIVSDETAGVLATSSVKLARAIVNKVLEEA